MVYLLKLSPSSGSRRQDALLTWHTEVRMAVVLVMATLPVDLTQVVARAGVGVAGPYGSKAR